MFLKILVFKARASLDSNGMLCFCKYAWKPIAPNPKLRSCSALYLALPISSPAWSIKNCNTLSRKRVKSATISVSFHSSYFSRLTEDRQQTAVRSSLVTKWISLHKLLPLIFRPSFFCTSGNALLAVSIKFKYGSPVLYLVSRMVSHNLRAEIISLISSSLGSFSSQSISISTASMKSSDRLTA